MRLTELLLKLVRGPTLGDSGGEGSMSPLRGRDDGRSVDILIEVLALCPAMGEAGA